MVSLFGSISFKVIPNSDTYITLICSFFRRNQHVLHNSIHTWDVGENVQLRITGNFKIDSFQQLRYSSLLFWNFHISGLLCVSIQQIWLFCCHRQYCWNGFNSAVHHATFGDICTPLCKAVEGFQSNEVSITNTYFNGIKS